jgi:NADH-quinone oxidoreductase subunit A
MTPDQYQLLVVYLLLFLLVGVGFIFVHLVVGKFVRPARPDAEKMTIYECGEPTIGSAWIQFDLRFYVVALLFVIFDVEVAFFFPWAVVFGRANTLANPDLPSEQRIQTVKELVASKPAVEEFETSVRTLALIEFFEKHARDEKVAALVGDLSDEAPEKREEAAKQLLAMGAPPPLLKDGAKSAEVRVAELRLKDFRTNEETEQLKKVYNQVQGSIDAGRSLGWIALVDIAIFFGILLVGFAYLWKRGDLDWVRSVAAEKMAASGLEPGGSRGEEEVLVEMTKHE